MKRYRVIVADPPWLYGRSGFNADPNRHYRTLPLAELAAIPVREWAAADAVLALWGTWPHVEDVCPLARAWGFGPVTGFPWVKTTQDGNAVRRGCGWWVAGASEFVVIATRGEPAKNGVPVPVGLLTGEERTFYAPRRRHSEKPEGLQDWLEALCDGPYLELFSRRERPGWDCYGLDTGWHLSAAGARRVLPGKAPDLQGALSLGT